MEALPAGPRPAPRNQIIIGATLAGVAIVMLVGGMIGVWALQRTRSIDATGRWLPENAVIPEVASNVMLIAFAGLCVFAQWAVWSSRRGDHPHTAMALALTAFVAVLIINAQAFIWAKMELGLADSAYGSMFYSITGTFVALMVIGILLSAVAAFRYAGGRTREREILIAHAIYWYTVAVAFAAIWFVVYVTK